jgi:AAA ATPase domain
VLNARTAPKLAFVLAFVRAVVACADASDVSVPGAERDLTRWQHRWELMTAQQGAAGAARSGHDEHGVESPAQLRADVPWQLPMAPRLLIGRERELARLDARLAESPAAATPVTILLHGRAGVGKTALALAWAHRRREQFPDGQLYADFSAGTGVRELTATEVLIDFLAALGHSPAELPADESGLAAMFRSALAERTLLVVLENAERAGDARLCRSVLPADPEAEALAGLPGAVPVAIASGLRRHLGRVAVLTWSDPPRLMKGWVWTRSTALSRSAACRIE